MEDFQKAEIDHLTVIEKMLNVMKSLSVLSDDYKYILETIQSSEELARVITHIAEGVAEDKIKEGVFREEYRKRKNGPNKSH